MKNISIFVLFLITSNVEAFWMPFSEYTSKNIDISVFIETEEISESKGYKYFWILKNQSRKYNGVGSFKEYYQADCDNPQRYKTLKQIAYSENFGEGSVEATNNKKSKWVYPTPGSTGQSILKMGCDVSSVQNSDDKLSLQDFFELPEDVSTENFLYICFRCIGALEVAKHNAGDNSYNKFLDFYNTNSLRMLKTSEPNKNPSELNEYSFKKTRYYTSLYSHKPKDFVLSDISVCKYFIET